MEYISYQNVSFPKVGFGTFSLHGETLRDVLDVATSCNGMLIDTAFKYNNEVEIGQFLKDKKIPRNYVLLQTKLSVVELVKKRFLGFPVSKLTPFQTLMNSCKRMDVMRMDIYLLHSPSSGYVNRYKSIVELREQNLVDMIGVCNFNVEQLTDIYNGCGVYPQIVQVEIHPFHSNKQVIKYCKEHDILIEARSPFAHGDIMEELMNNPILIYIAKESGKTIPQIILRWIIQQGVVALPRTKNPKHIKENIDIFDFYLTESQMAQIDSLNRNQSFGYKSGKRQAI